MICWKLAKINYSFSKSRNFTDVCTVGGGGAQTCSPSSNLKTGVWHCVKFADYVQLHIWYSRYERNTILCRYPGIGSREPSEDSPYMVSEMQLILTTSEFLKTLIHSWPRGDIRLFWGTNFDPVKQCCFLVLLTGAITKWRNGKDWKDTEHYTHQKTIANQPNCPATPPLP